MQPNADRVPPRAETLPSRILLDQLWFRLPSARQQQLLRTLSRIIRQQTLPPLPREASDE